MHQATYHKAKCRQVKLKLRRVEKSSKSNGKLTGRSVPRHLNSYSGDLKNAGLQIYSIYILQGRPLAYLCWSAKRTRRESSPLQFSWVRQGFHTRISYSGKPRPAFQKRSRLQAMLYSYTLQRSVQTAMQKAIPSLKGSVQTTTQ